MPRPPLGGLLGAHSPDPLGDIWADCWAREALLMRGPAAGAEVQADYQRRLRAAFPLPTDEMPDAE